MSAIAMNRYESVPQLREVLQGGRVKGGMMAAHIKWVTDSHSGPEFGAFWSALPRGIQKAIDGMILPINWYDFSTLIAVDRAIVDTFGRGSSSVLREVGAYSATTNLGNVYKSYRRPSVHEFFGNGAKLHRQFQDFGEARYEQTGMMSGKMIHTAYDSYSPLYCQSALGFYAEAVTLHGMRAPHVIETSCQCRGEESCTFVIRWRQ